MMTIKDYMDYWDQWIQEWFKLASNHNSNNQLPSINLNFGNIQTSWPMLQANGGTNLSTVQCESWKFLPEPYWGIPNGKPLKGVFININPGEGGHLQHIKTQTEYRTVEKAKLNALECHILWEQQPEISYQTAIKKLYSIPNYGTTDWMLKKRQNFIHVYNKTYNKKEDLGDFAMFELCPWHTKSANKNVKNYIRKNLNLIDKYIIDFAIKTSEEVNGYFKNLIFAHGLDEKMISDNLITLNHVYTDDIKCGNKDWKVDISKKENSNVYIINFKNSSNGFPAMTDKLKNIIEDCRNEINKN